MSGRIWSFQFAGLGASRTRVRGTHGDSHLSLDLDRLIPAGAGTRWPANTYSYRKATIGSRREAR
jgi:hypothetical protein